MTKVGFEHVEFRVFWPVPSVSRQVPLQEVSLSRRV